MNYYRNYSENQILFDFNLRVIKLILKLISNIILHLPLLFSGYMGAQYILQKKSPLLLHLGLTLLASTILYVMIFIVKGIIIGLKTNYSLWWLPLFLFTVLFVCILPSWMLLQVNVSIIPFIKVHNWASWITILAYSTIIYLRYNFLKNIAPKPVFPFYQAGISLTCVLLRFKVPRQLLRFIFGK